MQRKQTDRCPGNVVLHEAADGWLARVRIPGGRITADQLLALAPAASLGSGLVELTSRANLQLRGLPADGAEEFGRIVRRAGLLPSVAHDRARNVIASPVAGRHATSRAHTDAIVDGIDRGLCANPRLAELPGRFLFAVDDGSGIALNQPADVALISRDADTYSLALAGQASVETVPAADAAKASVAAAAAFLDERRERGVDAWRIAELDHGAAAIAHRVGVTIAETLEARACPALVPGRLEQRDGRFALTGLAPLGRLDGPDLTRLGSIAPEVRLGTGRTLTVCDVDSAGADEVETQLASLGLLLHPDSGWVGLTACAGLGRCAKARIDVSSAAAARARTRRPGAPAEHWAACERRCGERPAQPIAVAAGFDSVAVRIGGAEQLASSAEDAIAALAV